MTSVKKMSWDSWCVCLVFAYNKNWLNALLLNRINFITDFVNDFSFLSLRNGGCDSIHENLQIRLRSAQAQENKTRKEKKLELSG